MTAADVALRVPGVWTSLQEAEQLERDGCVEFCTSSTKTSALRNVSLQGRTVQVFETPLLGQGGVVAHQEKIPVPLNGADGVVGSTLRSHRMDFRAAHRLDKERFADIYKEASRQL